MKQAVISARSAQRLRRERDALRTQAEAFEAKLAETRKQLRLVSRSAKTQPAAAAELVRVREEQQATAEVLRVVSRSGADAVPVFDAIRASLHRLFPGFDAAIWLVEGGELKGVSQGGETVPAAPPRPVPLHPDYASTRAVEEVRVIAIEDVGTDPQVSEAFRAHLRRRMRAALLYAPLVKDGKALGLIGMSRVEPTRFTEGQVRLLQTFADQAVIAIENARLFQALEDRNRELDRSLRHQKASSDVLRIVSSSLTDTQPVFDAIRVALLESIPDAAMASVWLREQDELVAVAIAGRLRRSVPMDWGTQSVLTRSMVERRAARSNDAARDETLSSDEKARLAASGIQSVVSAPLLSHGEVIGVIGVSSKLAGAFDSQHVELMQTFADQAVIAIENARLFNELQETIQHQNATGEVLRIVSGSVSDAGPVFEAIHASVLRLFEGFNASIYMVEEDRLVPVARGGSDLIELELPTLPLTRNSGPGRVVIDGRPVWHEDFSQAADLSDEARERMRGIL